MLKTTQVLCSLVGVVFSVFILPSLGSAQGTNQLCRLGTQDWVAGCAASCTDSWSGGNCPQTCTAAPPPGTIIVDHRLIDHSISNGGRSISFIAADQRFDYKRHVEQAYEAAINAAARNGDTRYAASLREQSRSAIREAESLASSHQMIRLNVNASKHGSMFDRKRGWSNVSVEMLTRCIAPQNMTEQLLQQAPSRRR